MNDKIRAVDLIISYVISLIVVGSFYILDILDFEVYYSILLRLTGLLTICGVIAILLENVIDPTGEKISFFQKQPRSLVVEAFSVVCVIAIVSPAVVCIFESVILKIVFYGL